MSTITVVGGTGYAGSAIVREAASRGHEVVSFSRSVPAEEARVDGVRYETGSMLDAEARLRAVTGSDVVVSSLSPRRARRADRRGRPGPGRPRGRARRPLRRRRRLQLAPSRGGRPASGRHRPAAPEFASEAKQMNEVLELLGGTDDSLDWFFVSPAQLFGAYAPARRAASTAPAATWPSPTPRASRP